MEWDKSRYLHNLADLEYSIRLQEARTKMEQGVMTIDDLCTYLHIHSSTVYRMLKKHTIPGFKIGRDWRFNKESIDKWRNALEHEHDPH